MFGFRKKSHLNLLGLYAEELTAEVAQHLPWRRRKRDRLFFILSCVVWGLTIALTVLIINIVWLLPSLKNIYWQSLAGKGQLEKAVYLVGQSNWPDLNKSAEAARTNFSDALSGLQKFKWSPVGWLPFTRGKINDGERLLTAGELIAKTLSQASATANNFLALLPDKNKTAVAALGDKEKTALIKLIADSQDDLAGAKDNLEQARLALSQISNRELLMSRGVDLDELSKELLLAQAQIDKASALAKILPALGGYPKPANYLFVLQNSDELRPTGGFIGTYGLATAVNGSITRLDTHDVYHLDMPVINRWRVEPPAPLKKYLNMDNWYLRDANWSPDWPTTAQKIAWFYQEENKLQAKPDPLANFDYIIGLTPKAIIDLMELTGPLTARGQIYNQDNFMALLQETTGLTYKQQGISSWDRKAIIGELSRQLQLKILAGVNNHWSRLLDIVSNNLEAKNILVYTTNPDIYAMLKDKGWLGELKATDGDFLMAVDANLAAFKTDAVVNKSMSYTVQETSDGLIAKAQINYANRGNFSWKTTRYRTFTRLYVPKGSELIRVAGHSGSSDEVVVGEELGHTYFGAFIEIDPGKIGGLSFEYKLPYNLLTQAKAGHYSLLVAKQPGNRANELFVDLQFKQNIKQHDPAIFYSYVTGSRARWKSDLLTDKIFTVNFN
jgi:hypothetical protein